MTGPWITQKEIDYVSEAVKNCWYENATLYHQRFEAAFAQYVGRRFAIAVPHCTSAIHLALMGLGIGPGDEVIVPEITWIGSSAPIDYVGATPVFADIDPVSWCLDVSSFERCITERTKAVILVDLYGVFPNLDKILEIAAQRGIAVIEDAAQAIGAEYFGKKAGSFGAASVFSFHGTKLLTTGEGGMFLTDDEKLFQRCRYLADHGRDLGEKLFWNTAVAYKYKMSALQAAMGLAQLERIEELVERRREIFFWYKDELSQIPGIVMNQEPPGVKSTFWMTTIILPDWCSLNKEDFMGQLKARGITTRPFQYPLSSLPAYAAHSTYETLNPNAYSLSPRGLNLPSGFNLDRETVRYVSACVKEILQQNSTSDSLSEPLAVVAAK